MTERTRRYVPAFMISVMLIVIAVVLFTVQVNRHSPDIYLHSELNMKPWGAEIYSHPFYFLLLKAVSGFSANIDVVNNAAIVILTLFTWLKMLLVYMVLKANVRNTAPIVNDRQLWAVAFFLSIIHAIPVGRYPLMLGYFTANSWHNSTIITDIPFALLQFYWASLLLRQYSRRLVYCLSLATILSVLSKPNFFLCFAPVYMLLMFCMAGRRFNKRFLLSVLPVIAGSAVMAAAYWLTYSFSPNGGIGI
ncbi:MAG TPA: hypothetical protein VLD19_19095, partial [Chitinophagaceae bacterium]|nr:hypothetical protein [Chitinophagaceae bacterium]